jgi:hypothetical protein
MTLCLKERTDDIRTITDYQHSLQYRGRGRRVQGNMRQKNFTGHMTQKPDKMMIIVIINSYPVSCTLISVLNIRIQ